MPLVLQSRFRKLFAAAVVIVAAGLYSAQSLRDFTAWRLSGSAEGDKLVQAIRLQPGNAALYSRLARVKLIVEQDLAGSTENFQRALDRNPFAADDWVELAAVYQVAGDAARQQRALDTAIEVDPHTPRIAMAVSGFYLVGGNFDRALSLLKTVVEYDTEDSARQAIATAWRATGDVDRVASALPQTVTAQEMFMEVLLNEHKMAAAQVLWQHMVALNQPLTGPTPLGYVEWLLHDRQVDAAIKAWRDLGNLNPAMQPYMPSDNLVVNGTFEADLLDAGFDWHHASVPNVRFSYDSTQFLAGVRSLMVSYDGVVPEWNGLVQWVPVSPDAHYVFEIAVRADDMQSSSGPRFVIEDLFTGETLATTDDVLGTVPWKHLSVAFATRPATHVVAVRLVRRPAFGLIRGNLWIDDASLTRTSRTDR